MLMYTAFVCGKNCEIQIQTLVKQAKRLKEEYENKIGLGDIKNRMQECQDSFSDKVDEVEFEQTIRVELGKFIQSRNHTYLCSNTMQAKTL